MSLTTALAALSTVFTAPSGCATSTWLFTTNKVPSQYPPLPTNGPDPACDPPRWKDSMDERAYHFYSPAICPDGFAVGVSCTSVQLRTSEGFPSVTAGETVAFCVPSGYTCTADTTDFRGGVWGMTQTATTSGASVTVGPAMQIRWRDVDLTALQTHPLTPGLVVGATTSPGQPAASSQPPIRIVPPPPIPSVPQPSTSTRSGPDVVVVPVPTTSTLLFTTLSTSSRTSVPDTRPASSPLVTPSSSTGGPLAGTTTATSRISSTLPPSSQTSSPSTSENALISGPSSGVPVGPIILACLLSILSLVLVAFFLFRGRQGRKGPDSGPMLPVGLGVWVGRTKGAPWRRWLPTGRPKTRGIGSADAKSAAVGMPGGPRPLGTAENPAELCEYGNRYESVEEQRWSWVSRMFSIRAGRDGRPGSMTDEEYETGTGRDSKRSTRSSRWTAWDSDGAVGEQQMNLSVPPVPVPMPPPVLLAPPPKSFSARRSMASVQTTRSMRSTKTPKSLRTEAANRAARQSAAHLSVFGGGAPLRSPMKSPMKSPMSSPGISPFLAPEPSPSRLSRISDGTFGGFGGNHSDDDSSSVGRTRSPRASLGP
ncbi:hypothetical protein RB598_004469 [Gaeumannomyces tritici]